MSVGSCVALAASAEPWQVHGVRTAAGGTIRIPKEVRDHVRGVFADVNRRTSYRLTRSPNTHEGSLDLTFIEATSEHAAPVKLASNWIVRLDTHFLGGRRHYRNWEIADIGVLIQVRKKGKLVATKLALLQSKRLYPRESAFEEEDVTDYHIGFARLFREDTPYARVVEPRKLSFNDESRYQALRVGDGQFGAVEAYEQQLGVEVHYLLYHPWRIPHEVTIPIVEAKRARGKNAIGCRVIPSADLRGALADREAGYSPKYEDLKHVQPKPQAPSKNPPGWRVEEFVADLCLRCKAGFLVAGPNDEKLFRVFNRRSGPIGAAIAVTFDAP